ncbi:MAG: sigma-70 family RNA polymerase sigma factor [Phycisphaeraceae bacterium]
MPATLTKTKPNKPSGRPQLGAVDAQRLEELLEIEVYDYMNDEIFQEPPARAEKLIYRQAEAVPEPDTSWYAPMIEDLIAPPTRAVRAGTVLLTAKQERALFLQFNYARYRASKLHDRLRRARKLNVETAKKFLAWHDRADAYREQIANTNLALVLAMAKRTRPNDLEFADMVSEGNMALLRAVDKFDVSRGFKFSTYACRAILKSFSRAGQKQTKHRRLFSAEYDVKYEKSDFLKKKREAHEEDCVAEVGEIIRDNAAELTPVERTVIEHRFGLREATRRSNGRGHTLEQVGRTIGVTKERVRQIQNRALEKLRDHMEDDVLN